MTHNTYKPGDKFLLPVTFRYEDRHPSAHVLIVTPDGGNSSVMIPVEDHAALIPADRITELEEALDRFQRLDAQAATYVETLIIQRCPQFTGEEPYVGWEGLGLALRERLDELEKLAGKEES